MLIKKSVKLAAGMIGITAIALLSGCAKQKTYGAVKFVSSPAGAEVVNLRDDTTLCTSPCVAVWEGEDGKPEHVTVQMRKTGYKEEITTMWVNTRYDSRAQAEQQPQDINIELVKRENK